MTPSAAGDNLAAGQRLDLRQLVHQHHGLVYRYAFRLSGKAQDAEDLTQQTFLLAQQNFSQLREADKAKAWLCAILRSCYLKSRRRTRPLPAGPMDLDLDHLPEVLADREEIDQERLQFALDELPDEFKLVVVMFYFEDCSYKEISEQLEVPLGTVMSRLSRGKALLKKALAEGESPPTLAGKNKENGLDCRTDAAAARRV